MDQRRIVIIATAVGILILAIILGTIIYLSQNFKSTKSSTKVVTSSPLPSINVPQMSPSPTSQGRGAAGGVPTIPNTKTYVGQGFSVYYPKDWALLTCNNSQNFEFDPYSGTDQLKVSCGLALKPITVLVNSGARCNGTTITLGSNTVIKSKVVESSGDIDYRWCTQTTPMLDITHRVSSTGQRATSKDDFSQAIEDMISHITFGVVGGS